MIATEANTTKKIRGIIVADSNEVSTFSMPYEKNQVIESSPLAKMRSATGSYLDLLPLLAKQGYQIIIPETVAKESGNILSYKTSMDAEIEKKPDRYKGEQTVRGFLKKVRDGDILGKCYPGVDIAAARGSQPYVQYLNKISSVRATDGRVRSEYSPEELKHFGEQHCIDIIEDEIKQQRKSGESIPIFFLSADGGARDELREVVLKLVDHENWVQLNKLPHDTDLQKHKYRDISKTLLSELKNPPPVNVLTALGILKALGGVESRSYGKHALPELGLSGSAKGHWEHIKRGNTGQKLPKYGDSSDWYDDSTLAASNSGKHPFADSVIGLADEIVKNRHKPDVAENGVGQSHANKARQKYINHPGGVYGPGVGARR